MYFYPDKNFYVLNGFDDLKYLLSKCNQASLEMFEKRLHISEILNDSKEQQSTLEFAY